MSLIEFEKNLLRFNNWLAYSVIKHLKINYTGGEVYEKTTNTFSYSSTFILL